MSGTAAETIIRGVDSFSPGGKENQVYDYKTFSVFCGGDGRGREGALILG